MNTAGGIDVTLMEFTIPGEPRGWARARASSAGGFVRMHQPKGNDEWRATVQLAAREVMDGRAPTRMPVSVHVGARWSRPASHIGKRGVLASAPARRVQKPDIDNLAKGILDSLNGIVWHDDVQVVELHVAKRWCVQGEAPGTDVVVIFLGEEATPP